MRTYTLTEHEAGQRLDRYLRKLLPTVPLGAIFRHLRHGSIRIDGKKAKPDLRLVAGMSLLLKLPDADLDAAPGDQAAVLPKAPHARDSQLKPRIVHRDDDIMVVSKPAGLATQPGTGNDDDMVAWLLGLHHGTRTATFHPAPAHRIDRGTSGLVAVGMSPLGLRGLAAAFRDDQVDKVYLAVVHGVPEPAKGTIDAPLLLQPNAHTSQPKTIVDATGKPARTDYEVVEVHGERALLRLVLHSGRLHQIRAHLAHLGHPIVGDRRYGSNTDIGRSVFLLHAAELSFPHPRSGERVHVRAAPPPAFQKALRGD